MSPWRGAVVSAWLTALAACGGAGSDESTVPEWTLSAEPLLVIGEDGTPADEFQRVWDVLALPGGEIAVVDIGAREIRVFDAAGVWQRTLGREGAGPGEFNSIVWVQLSGDTLVAFDINQRRITMLDLNGAVVATIVPRAEGDYGFAYPRTRTTSGDWVVTVNIALANAAEQGAGIPSGLIRDSLGVGLLPHSGEGATNVFSRLPAQPFVGIPELRIGTMAPLFASPQVVAVRDRIAVLDPEAGTLSWYASSGDLVETVALDIPRRTVTGSWLDSTRDARLAEVTEQRQRTIAEAIFTPRTAPAEFPVFRSVLVDGPDQLWLEEWKYPSPPRHRYLVVGPDGSWRATILLPPGFALKSVGSDWILGVHADADGLNRVMKFGLERR